MTFDVRQALRNLDIEVKPFGYGGELMSAYPVDNYKGLRGYSLDRWLAINPEEPWPLVVTFHEMAHILRGDTTVYRRMGVNAASIFTPKQSKKIADFKNYMRVHGGIIEAECHVTGILAAQMTNSPLDLEFETREAYAYASDIPQSVIENADKTARIIAKAGGDRTLLTA